MNEDRHEALAGLLLALEQSMRTANLWDCREPTPQALQSQQPFCVDTLDLEQWLKYVFIARLQTLMAQRAPLPCQCDITPIAEEAFKQPDMLEVVGVIQRIDKLLNVAAR